MTIPIPSTAPSGSYVPNTEPLSGAPSSANGDRAPLDQPRLESARPSQSNGQDGYRSDIDRYLDENRSGNSSNSNTTPQTKTEWRLQNPADSSVFGSNAKGTSDRMITAANEAPSNLGYSSVHPIQAPPEYVSPFQRRTLEVQPQPTEQDRPLTAPPLPPSNEQPINASNRGRGNDLIPVREAALVRQRTFETETRHQVNRTYQSDVRQTQFQQPEPRTPPKRKRQESGWSSIRP
ncbi:hypothetical protein RMSM_07641 [Rhodopirellula maiorica SM1]|uniref:Uncharacterized protein n=2 Tax=Novipirellula TaxID=2795426 RepID=M5RJ86_9BACT|nr:hypothetical protein RMSM_07641 [Rhodopirellula maiorica SM1]